MITGHKDSTAAKHVRRAVILTALEVETRSVLRHVTVVTEHTVSHTVFHVGRFENWEIAVAEIGAGNVPASAIAERAFQHFEPEVALFVGVAGGIKDVNIGDVVVATKVYGYESGKESEEGFQYRPAIQNTAHALEQRSRAIRLKSEWQKRITARPTAWEARIHVGPIAAGEKVVASSRGPTASLVHKIYGDALAIEMEGRGFLEGVHINVPVLGGVIRGISDLLDGKSSADASGSQERAADGASAVAFEILATLSPPATAVAIQVSASPPTPSAKLIFVVNDDRSSWEKADDWLLFPDAIKVRGEWWVSNLSGSDVEFLKVRLADEQARFTELYNRAIAAGQTAQISALFYFSPPIIHDEGPLIADIVFTDKYGEQYTATTRFRFLNLRGMVS
ncbi:MAG: High-affnity carbon uptake protein Hat/HatR [Bryobacterales bacterium]|nr:High-affnity carbon uptake protein Hat/HatR [Bryobacterales bacterium]